MHSKSSPLDFIIVGQGIAGTVMSQILLEQEKKIVLIDDWNYSASSKVSAGLYNPIVFKRLTKSWRVDELLPFAEIFYKRLEQQLNERFFFRKEIIKLFSEENEKIFWLKKAKEEGLKEYLAEAIEEVFFPESLNSPLGAGNVRKAGYVDVKKMLSIYREFLRKQNILVEEKFNYSDLLIQPDQIEYKGIRAKKIIFCEGFRATENPWFQWLPFKLSKGEILTIKVEGPCPDQVINKGVFLLPLGNNLYKVGSTYHWEDLNEQPTEKGKIELCEKLERILKIPYQIIAHEAGIRPTVSDRRPLIGIHPQHPAITVFNGMGTKGAMLAPYFAAHFSLVLEGKETLNKEVTILRFWNG